MCSKYTFLENVETVISPKKKKYKDSTEDSSVTSKKIKEGGRTLAQKRLDKIRQGVKAAVKSEETSQNVKKGKLFSTSSKGETSSKGATSISQDKKQIEEEKSNLKKSSKLHHIRNEAQSRFDKYKRERKKEDIMKELIKSKKRSEETVYKKIPLTDVMRSTIRKEADDRMSIDEETRKDKLINEVVMKNIDNSSKAQRKLKHSPRQTLKTRSSNQQDKANNNLHRNLYKRKSASKCLDINYITEISEKKFKCDEQPKSSFILKPSSSILRSNLEKEILRLKESARTVTDNKLKMTTLEESDVLKKHESSRNISKDNSFVEDMEWEVTCEDVVVHLQTARHTVNNNDDFERMDWQESPLQINKTPDSSIIHYVVDTNIFISSLRLIRKIKEHITEGIQNIIVIPWQVLKELDCLKNSSTSHISKAARKTVEYLLNCMAEHSSNVVWQTQQQAAEDCPDFFVEIPDDHIIKCCFQLNSSGHNVVLLSNDKNLRLKASVHKIATISDEKLLEKLALQTDRKKEKFPLEEPPLGTSELEIYTHKFTEVFKTFLNNVIKKYLLSMYGNMWIWYLPEKPPLSLSTLLDLFKNVGEKIFINDDYKNYLVQVTSFLTFRTYPKLNTSLVDNIVRMSLKLAKLLPSEKTFILDALQFEDDLSFLKSREPTSHIPYNELCCKLTIQHFQTFESMIVGYCCKLAEVLGLNFAESILSDRPSFVPDKFDIKSLSDQIKMVKVMNVNLERIGRISTDQICPYTRGVVPIYNTLVSCIENHDPFFTIQDVVEFCKNDNIRISLPEALEIFGNVLQYLEMARKVAISKGVL